MRRKRTFLHSSLDLLERRVVLSRTCFVRLAAPILRAQSHYKTFISFLPSTPLGIPAMTPASRGIQTPINFWNSDTHQLLEFRHPSTSRSEQLAMITALEAARRSETELVETIVARA
jgi:hypothetical protein